MTNTNCPFTAALSSGLHLRHLISLARITRVAHRPDDLWTGCRVERALNGYVGVSLAPLLAGRFFAGWVADETHEIADLEGLQNHAEAFLIANEVL